MIPLGNLKIQVPNAPRRRPYLQGMMPTARFDLQGTTKCSFHEAGHAARPSRRLLGAVRNPPWSYEQENE